MTSSPHSHLLGCKEAQARKVPVPSAPALRETPESRHVHGQHVGYRAPCPGQGPLFHPRAPWTGCQGQRGDRDNPQEGSRIPGAKIPSPLLHPTSSRSLARTCSSISTSTGAISYVYLEGSSRSHRFPSPWNIRTPNAFPRSLSTPKPSHSAPKTLPPPAEPPLHQHQHWGLNQRSQDRVLAGPFSFGLLNTPKKPSLQTSSSPQLLPLHQHQGLLAGRSGRGKGHGRFLGDPPTHQPPFGGVGGSRARVEGLGEEPASQGMVVQPREKLVEEPGVTWGNTGKGDIGWSGEDMGGDRER